jgi:hypothetical protein
MTVTGKHSVYLSHGWRAITSSQAVVQQNSGPRWHWMRMSQTITKDQGQEERVIPDMLRRLWPANPGIGVEIEIVTGAAEGSLSYMVYTSSVSFWLSLDSSILHYPATTKTKRREYITPTAIST